MVASFCCLVAFVHVISSQAPQPRHTFWDYNPIDDLTDWTDSNAQVVSNTITKIKIWGTGYIYRTQSVNTNGYHHIHIEFELNLSENSGLNSGEYATIQYQIDNQVTNWKTIAEYSQGQLPLQDDLELPVDANNNNGVRIRFLNSGGSSCQSTGCDSFFVQDRLRLIGTIITKSPTEDPTKNPTKNPSYPTNYPTKTPTNNPTNNPTQDPTSGPTHYPTNNPTMHPTKHPGVNPTHDPTKDPSFIPTKLPTTNPTLTTETPSKTPSKTPSRIPSKIPSKIPSTIHTEKPSIAPSETVTKNPTKHPTNQQNLEFKASDMSLFIVTSIIICIVSLIICVLLILLCRKRNKKRKGSQINMELTTTTSVRTDQLEPTHSTNIINIKVETNNDTNNVVLKTWLQSIHLVEYYDTFIENGFDKIMALKLLDDAGLKEMGISNVSHRNVILSNLKSVIKEGKQTKYGEDGEDDEDDSSTEKLFASPKQQFMITPLINNNITDNKENGDDDDDDDDMYTYQQQVSVAQNATTGV